MRSRVHVILTFALGLALAAGCSSSEDASETTTALSGEGEQAGSDTAVRQPVETDTESSASVEPVQDAASETSETDAASTVADSTTSSGEQDSFVEEEPTEPVSDSVETEGGEGEPEVVVDAGIAPDTSEPAIEDAGGSEEVDLSALNLFGELPQDAVPPTQFIAENYDGGTRTEADLVGKPTVMWFFPFAGTPG